MQHPDIYYVLAWNFKKEILKNNKYLIKRSKILFSDKSKIKKYMKNILITGSTGFLGTHLVNFLKKMLNLNF